jgi:hypothetical protein
MIPTPAQMSYWDNSSYGDCVSAEEWWAKMVYPSWYDKTKPFNFMSQSSCVQWAFTHGYLFGADLTSVMDSMASSGPNYNGTTYTDGPYVSVDYTNRTTLCSAIFQGPVKLGVAAGPLQNVVNGANGWFLVNAGKDTNYDHCIGMWGYGTISYLASALGVQVPAGTDGTKFGYGLFTWDTMGIADEPSFLNIVEEAWLRNPTTPQTPPGPPTPTPTPTPGGLVWALVNPPAGASIDQSGNFSWPIPATQPNEYMTITFTVASGTGAPTTGQFQITISAAVPGSVTIAPIPGQSAASGSTFTLNLNQYVTVNKGSPAPGKQLPVPPLPAQNP